jgi:hypothetical protein
MAKKKQTKKHRFKYAEPVGSGVGSTPTIAPIPDVASASVPRSNPIGVSSRDFAYVRRDLRRLSILAAGLIIFELILWWLFGHSGLGSAVYSLVHV